MAIIEIFISISSHIALSLITSWCFKRQQQQTKKNEIFEEQILCSYGIWKYEWNRTTTTKYHFEEKKKDFMD